MSDNPLEDLLHCIALDRVEHDDGGHSFTPATHQDIDRAREIGTQYVKDNRDDPFFADFRAWGDGEDAREKTVQACELFRTAGMRTQWAKAEAWLFAKWEPLNLTGTIQPVLRNVGL